jgi:hypothetical protein
MFCQTEREIALFDLLTQRFPNKHPQLLELIAWCGINRPERLQELFERHKDDGESTLIDLADLDFKALCPPPADTQITIDHDNL